jgi:hypothetical protein
MSFCVTFGFVAPAVSDDHDVDRSDTYDRVAGRAEMTFAKHVEGMRLCYRSTTTEKDTRSPYSARRQRLARGHTNLVKFTRLLSAPKQNACPDPSSAGCAGSALGPPVRAAPSLVAGGLVCVIVCRLWVASRIVDAPIWRRATPSRTIFGRMRGTTDVDHKAFTAPNRRARPWPPSSPAHRSLR